MLENLRALVRSTPAIFDRLVVIRRLLGERPDPYAMFDRLSSEAKRPIRFIQIGANDGLRGDPVREFILRDGWSGVLVEPIPASFELLQKNYRKVPEGRLVFLNAAISDGHSAELELWCFKDAFLAALPLEKRMGYLRKTSFSRERMVAECEAGVDPHLVLEKVSVPCLGLVDLWDRYGKEDALDLLVIDAEGHEAAILGEINFAEFRPRALYFEHRHIESEAKAALFERLGQAGYRLELFDFDVAAEWSDSTD